MYYYIDPFGCVKNQVDAETMMAFLNETLGIPVKDPAEADIIIINSCGFIESAKQESINAVLSYHKIYPNKKIILAGCLAQRYAQELAGSLPEVDLFFGNRDISKITEALSALIGGDSPRIVIPEAASGEALSIPGKRPLLSMSGSAYIKVSEGCNNRCTFCSIPLIRGPLISRPIPQILQECKELLDRGIRELCLIGQDLGSYGFDRDPKTGSSAPGETGLHRSQLPELLEALSSLEGRFWVRLLYIHPDNVPTSILEIIQGDSRLLPYFDLPFQHGSAKILRAMNRRGTTASYLALLERIRAFLPDAVIRSTFLTGFPGETPRDFQALLDFQDQAVLDWVGCFTYSREDHTPAYSMKPRIPNYMAVKRRRIIEERQIAITEKQMDRFIGRNMDVLVEEALDSAEGLYLGRLPCHAPEVDGTAIIRSDRVLEPGTFVQGKIFARGGFDLHVQAAWEV